jgi:hypothetical protein
MNNIIDNGALYITDLVPLQPISKWQPNTTIDCSVRNRMINAYWGSGGARKYFPINEDDIKDLLIIGGGKVMIEVQNKKTPTDLRMKWIPYDKTIAQNNLNSDYYVIEQGFFDNQNPPDIPDGIFYSFGDIICATMGVGNGNYFVIVNQIYCNLVNNGSGGPPPGSGLQVPKP